MGGLEDGFAMIAERGRPIAVVGAGPGGLATAVLLAASGLRVCVYEADGVIGGRTGAIERAGGGDGVVGFRFDRGPTFFLMPYVLDRIFAAAGRRLSDYVELHRLDPMYRLMVGQRGGGEPVTIDCTQDLAEMEHRVSAIEPEDGAAFCAFIAENRAKLRLMTPILESPMRSPMDLLNVATAKVGPMLHPHQSVHTWLGKRFKNPAVRLALSFQSKYLGMSPYHCPSLFSILPFIEYEYGIWHPIGGCNRLMHALAEVLVELGGEIRTSSAVERLHFSGCKLTGLTIFGGERFDHDHVVINADAAWALKNLVPERLRTGLREVLTTRGSWSDAAIEKKKYSCSTFMLYLGVRGKVEHLPHHTIYVSGRYEENLADISEHGGLSEDPSLYVCNPSRVDPTMAPEGCSSLYVLMPTANLGVGGEGSADWDALRSRARKQCYEQLEERFGIGDIRSRVMEEVVVTPRDWEFQNIFRGATFNLAHGLDQMLHRRVQHELPGAEGVWFVGGGTHPGSGLPVIFLSSQITSRLLCERVGGVWAGAGGVGVVCGGRVGEKVVFGG